MISIVIPTYNRADMVCRAVESCLAEPIANRQVVVVDDGSTDDTEPRLQQYVGRITYRRLEHNQGVQTARNLGMTLATQTYIKFLDSDDYLQAGSLAAELAVAEQGRADIVVSGWGSVSDEGDTITRQAPAFGTGERIIDDVLHGKGVHTTAALYRRAYLQQHKIVWDTAIDKLNDWDFFAQAALSLGKIITREGIAYWQVGHAGPRITDASMLKNALCHHRVLAKLEAKIVALGMLTDARKTRLAEYHFKELQVLARYHWPSFLVGVENIRRLDPTLNPERAIGNRVLGKLARYFGIRPTFRVYAALKGRA